MTSNTGEGSLLRAGDNSTLRELFGRSIRSDGSDGSLYGDNVMRFREQYVRVTEKKRELVNDLAFLAMNLSFHLFISHCNMKLISAEENIYF